MKYIVVENTNMRLFTESMDLLLKDGWACQGGVCVKEQPNNANHIYYQAMIK
jgi:hypothetical protein